MTTDEVVQGIETHTRLFLNLLQRLTVLIEYENRILLCEGCECIALRDARFQALKHRLFGKFDTYARILRGCIRHGHMQDKELVKQLIPALLAFRSTVAMNSLLLESYMSRQQAFIARIMHSIDDSTALDESVCH